MVNLEKMLRQLMESQMQRAEGGPAAVEEEVVDLGPAQVLQPPAQLVDLAASMVPTSGDLSQRHIQSSLTVEEDFDHQVGRLEREDAATQLTHAGHDLGQLGHEDAYSQLQIPVELTSPNVAKLVAAMMKTPQGMAQAVVLGEIMNRPTDRW
tara:strand:+ start:162 stop:617 length:456 start_codon:yes stop_codon:yes gene_type:complete